MSADESITNLSDAVAAMGALPVPVGPEPQAPERDRLRAAFVEALDNAHQTHPCPVLGDRLWSGCVHYDEVGRVAGVGACHNERRADAVLAVRDAELESVRARVAELLAERHTTNEALDDAVQALRAVEAPGGTYPPALPWAALMDGEDLHDFLGELADAAIRLMDGRAALAEVERACSTWRLIAEAQHGHNTAPGPDAVGPDSPEMRSLREALTGSPDRLTSTFVPVASLREPEGEFYPFLHRDGRVPHDMPETGGTS